MTDQLPLPRVAPLDREAVAKIEVGQTAVSPAVAWALAAFFLAAIVLVPMSEMIGRRGTPAAATAWTRLAETPGIVASAWRPGAHAAGAAGLWNRTVAANRAALAGMAAFEDALEEESLLGRTLRPRAQVVLSGLLGAGNERVYLGRDGWLYFRTDTEYVTGGGFLDPRRLRRRVAAADEWTMPPQPDPRVAILDFHRQLAARGITLIVMPTPVKPSIHPEQFAAALQGWRAPLQNPSYAAFVEDLERAGVRVFDPATLLTAGRIDGPQYLATDTHWRPEAMEATAGRLAALVRQVGLAERPAPEYRIDERGVSNRGDTAAMLDLPAEQRLYPPEDAWIRRVLDADGGLWRSSRDADVLVLGDSFSNMYSLQSMGWGESAGFVEHLSYALGRPVDRIVQNDAAAFATRELLAQAGPARLAGKRVVIWQFATRELAFGDWKVIPLP
jgi:alginate O-acetyltransferase complex protein AlgJ